MKTTSTANGQKKVAQREREEPEGWRDWRTERRAAKELGLALQKLRGYYPECEHEPRHMSDGTWRVSPEMFEALRVIIEEDAPEVDVSANALRVATSHAERAVNGALSFWDRMAARYESMLTAQAERIAALETQLSESRARDEENANEAHARALATLQINKAEERKAGAWKMLIDRAPDIFAKLSGPNAAAAKLLQSLSPMQVQVLAASDFVTEEQKALLRELAPAVQSSGEAVPETEPEKESPP